MREIKFRAWDKTINYMDDRVRVTTIENEIVVEALDGFTKWRELDDFVLMQYTGLKDKNGREIYEGDIILAGHYMWKCKVVWDEKCARFIGLTNDKDVSIVYVGMVDKNNESAVEVVGNIYENPELLHTLN